MWLDNCFNPKHMSIVERWDKDETTGITTRFACWCPSVAKYYNDEMGDVDASSAHRSGFQIDIKPGKGRLHNRMFWSLLDGFVLGM